MDTRDNFKKQFQEQISQMGKQLEELREGASHAVAEAREELTEAADSLEERRDAIVAKMKDLKESEMWDDLKQEADTFLDEAREGLGRLFDRFRGSDDSN